MVGFQEEGGRKVGLKGNQGEQEQEQRRKRVPGRDPGHNKNQEQADWLRVPVGAPGVRRLER